MVVGTSTRTQQRSGEAKRHPTIQVPTWETTLGTDGSVPSTHPGDRRGRDSDDDDPDDDDDDDDDEVPQ